MRCSPPGLLDLLRDWYRIARPTVWLFPGRDPMLPMTTRQFNRAVHTAAGMAEIKKPVTPHTLRTVLPPPARAEYRCSPERRQRSVFIFSTKAWMSLRRSSALVMPFARAISSNASPRGRGTSVLTWTTGDRLLVTICAGCFLMRPSPPESGSDGILSELFVEPTERWHLRHVPLAWRHPYRSEVCRTHGGHGA